MCECGCGETSPDYKFAGPGGTIYGIQIYPGCRDCGTPVGVVLYRFDATADNEHWTEFAKPLSWHPYRDGGVDAEFGIPILSAEKLRAAILEEGGVVGPKPDDYETVADFLDDNCDTQALTNAVCATRREFEEKANTAPSQSPTEPNEST